MGDPTGSGVFAVGYVISRWYFRKLLSDLARNMLIQGIVAVGIARLEIEQAAEAAARSVQAFTAALGDIDAQERAAFEDVTRDIVGRRTKPES